MRQSISGYEKGLTLIEALITVAISIITISFAQSLFIDHVQDTHLKGATETVMRDLQWAKHRAMASGQPVSLSFTAAGNGHAACYAIHTNDGCDCQDPDSCRMHDGDGQIQQMGNFGTVRLVPHVSQHRFSFQIYRQTVTAGHVLLQNADGRQVKVVVSGYGRIRSCSPAGEAHLSGYPTC